MAIVIQYHTSCNFSFFPLQATTFQCLKKNLNASRLCFSYSAYWLPTRKNLLYTVANPVRGLLNREKRTQEKVWQHPPPPHAARFGDMYGHRIKQSMNQPGMVANPARGQLNRENEYFHAPVRA